MVQLQESLCASEAPVQSPGRFETTAGVMFEPFQIVPERPGGLQTVGFLNPTLPGGRQATIFVDPAPPGDLPTIIFVDPWRRRNH